MTVAGEVQAIQTETLDTLGSLLGGDTSAALLDFPAHLNAGDTLIYRGEVEYLRRMGVEIGYVSALHTHDDELLRELAPDGPILLHGGGNFGDRYGRHQQFREAIVARYPDRTIVQLPQTMDFVDDEQLRHTQQIYARHPDLHLLIRDHAGFRRARAAFSDNDVRFCPDLAFGYGLLAPTSETTCDVVVLKRLDGESTGPTRSLPPRLVTDARVADWTIGTAFTVKWWLTTRVETSIHRFARLRRLVYPHMRRAFDHQADVVLRGAVDLVSSGRVVVTDRLHAAVFATLLGKPVVMVDNVNRKLSAAHVSYLDRFPDVRLATDFDDAADVVESLIH